MIKGLQIDKEGKEGNIWLQEFIKEKLEVESKIISSHRSGPVVVVRSEGEEKKKEIMKNKSKLKGHRIFIENDLSWEERKVQERINRWVKEKRSKGSDVKISFGRVRIGGILKTWGEIENGGGIERRTEERIEREKRNN